MTASSTSNPAAKEFKGRRVLVTGGTKGAGKAIAGSEFVIDGGTILTV